LATHSHSPFPSVHLHLQFKISCLFLIFTKKIRLNFLSYPANKQTDKHGSRHYSRTIAQFCRAISSQLRHVSTFDNRKPQSPARGLTVIAASMHGFANCRKFTCDLDLDLGSGQGHISIHNTCSTTSMPNHLNVVWRTTEIWQFECREISTVREVWTLVIAFLEGNLKIGFRQATEQVPYYHQQPSVLSLMRKWQRR